MTSSEKEHLLQVCEEIGLNFEIPSKVTIAEINKYFHKVFNASNVVEMWLDYGSLSDDGEIVKDYLFVNGDLYEFTLKLEVEWVGDYSVRANIATEFEITEIKKLPWK